MGGDTIAERLLLLCETGQELLPLVYAVKDKLVGPNRPFFLAEEKFAKLAQALVKDFPDTSKLDKVAGFGEYIAKSKEVKDTLCMYYDTLARVVEWNAGVVSLVDDVTSSFGDKIARSEMVRGLYMDTVVLFGKINVSVSMVHDRRALVAAYGRAFYQVECSAEPSYSKLGAYVAQVDYPFKFITDVLKNAEKVVHVVLETVPDTYMKVLNLQMLRKEGLLSLSNPADKMALPTDTPVQFDVLQRWRFWDWVTYGFLLTPASLMDGNAGSLLKMVLSDSNVSPVYRNLAVPMHAQYDWVIKSFKSKTIKLKPRGKIITDALAVASSPVAWAMRSEYRTYLRHELHNASCLLRDSPGIIGPKFNKIVALLQFAVVELHLYFAIHHSIPAKAKEKPDTDLHVPEIIHSMLQILTMMRVHWKLVVDYSLQYLSAGLRSRVVAMAGSSGAASDAVGRIAKELGAVSVETFRKGQEYDFSGLRLNILRAETALLGSSGCVQHQELLRVLRVVWQYSVTADSYGEVLESCGVHWVMWYRDQVQDMFESCMSDTCLIPSVAMTFVRLCSYYHENGPSFDSTAKESIGKTAVRVAKQLVESVSKRIISLMWEIAKSYLRFDKQLVISSAAYPLLQKIGYKFDKTFIPPVTPGTESNYGHRHELDGLRLQQRHCWQLCSALNEFTAVNVYNQQLVPREFLRDKLVQLLERFTGRSVQVTDDVVMRPSLLEANMIVFYGLLKQTENYIDLDMDAVIREFVLKNSWNAAVGDLCSLKYEVVKDDADVWVSDRCYMRAYSKFYGEFVAKRVVPGVVYSPHRNSFVSKQNMAVQVEDFTQPGEIMALCRIGGPYGIASIDQKIMRSVYDHLQFVKSTLVANNKTLLDIAKNYHKDIASFVKLLKDIDVLASRLISMGLMMKLRELMQNGVASTLAERSSPAISLLRSTTAEYAPNLFMRPELLGLDVLSSAAGVPLGSGDQALKALASRLISVEERAVWEQLPVLFAMIFSSKVVSESVWMPHIEAFQNNLHVAAMSVHALIVTAAVATSEKNSPAEVLDALRRFVEISSVFLLNHAQNGFGDVGLKEMQKIGIKSLPSLLIFLDLFVQQSDLLTADILDDCMPYVLLRAVYRDLYAAPREPAKKGDEWI